MKKDTLAKRHRRRKVFCHDCANASGNYDFDLDGLPIHCLCGKMNMAMILRAARFCEHYEKRRKKV